MPDISMEQVRDLLGKFHNHAKDQPQKRPDGTFILTELKLGNLPDVDFRKLTTDIRERLSAQPDMPEFLFRHRNRMEPNGRSILEIYFARPVRFSPVINIATECLRAPLRDAGYTYASARMYNAATMDFLHGTFQRTNSKRDVDPS